MKTDLLTAYRYWRGGGMRAAFALEKARVDTTNGTPRYPSHGKGRNAYFRAYGSTRMLWIERPASFGLRFVGHADEISKSVDHKGWYLDDDGTGATVRGVVYQIPGKGRAPRFLSGYADPHNDGPVCLDFGTIWEGEAPTLYTPSWGGSYWTYTDNPADHDGARDAAREADRLAERYAEDERDYRRAWEAGRLYAEATDDIATERRELLSLMLEFRRIRVLTPMPDAPRLCATVRAAIAKRLARIVKLRGKREALRGGTYSKGESYFAFSLRDDAQVSAFNDGAGNTIITT